MVRLACALILWASAVTAECRLALVLALDVSSSVDAREYDLQKTGVAGALGDADIRRTLLTGDWPVALAVYEWSGRRQHALVLDWVLLHDNAQIDTAIAAILAHPRSHSRFPTAMGYALGYGATLMERAPRCLRQVIDLSGDGISNDGFGPRLAYRHFPFHDITVNGLAVLGADPEVQAYFLNEVRHGPGAFVETAPGYEGYRTAMTRKLFREINDRVVGNLPTTQAADPG